MQRESWDVLQPFASSQPTLEGIVGHVKDPLVDIRAQSDFLFRWDETTVWSLFVEMSAVRLRRRKCEMPLLYGDICSCSLGECNRPTTVPVHLITASILTMVQGAK